MGLETLDTRRKRAKAKWWFKVNKMNGSRYPRKLLDKCWEVKPQRGRSRKTWKKCIDEIFTSLQIEKEEVQQRSFKEFINKLDELFRGKEYEQFMQGVSMKRKLALYKEFGENIEFKSYLHGIGDAGTRLLFKLRSGTNGLMEELGRHRDMENDQSCKICGSECESVEHFIWECALYEKQRKDFLQSILEVKEFDDFFQLESFGRTAFILSCNRLENNTLLQLIKGFLLECWEVRKEHLYGDTGHSLVTEASDLFCSAPLGCVVNGDSAMACTS